MPHSAMSVTDVCDPRDTIDDVGACNNSAVDVCDDIGLLLRSMPQALICSLPAEKKIYPFKQPF